MGFYISILAAYLLGGIPFGLLAAMLSGHGDIRVQGSGNIGATNVWRVAGPVPTFFAFLGDIGKGAVAVWLGRFLYAPSWPLPLSTAVLIIGVAAILGHVFSPYLRLRGGKGVNTALGVFAGLMPLEIALALMAFLVTLALFRYVSLGSIVAALVFAATVWLERFLLLRPIGPLYLVIATLVPVFIIYTHRQNIQRLRDGAESRFQWKRTPA